MTIYVDDLYLPKGKHKWCHLMSDTSLDELHTFAQGIGLKREWFQGDHYDVTTGKRWHAVQKGARQITKEEMVQIRKKLRRIALIDLALAGTEEPGEGMEMTRAAYGVGE